MSIFWQEGFRLGTLGFTICPHESYGNQEVIDEWNRGCQDGLNQKASIVLKKNPNLRKKLIGGRMVFND